MGTRTGVALLLLLAAAGQLDAWGLQGHRLVALIAAAHLTPAARANVTWLMPDRTLAEIASWADDYRLDHSASAPWHYVNPPVNAQLRVSSASTPPPITSDV